LDEAFAEAEGFFLEGVEGGGGGGDFDGEGVLDGAVGVVAAAEGVVDFLGDGFVGGGGFGFGGEGEVFGGDGFAGAGEADVGLA